MLATIDWAILLAYLALSLGIGLFYSKKASSSNEEFFLSGRTLPWWLIGTSMAATNFAADAPLAIAGIVAEQGIAGVWLKWSYMIAAALAVFLFARLWRRARVITDAEVVELRYSGGPAVALRLLKGVYFGVLLNCFIMGWVMVAMTKIMSATVGWSPFVTLLVFASITVVYTILSGFWGVVVTDFVQYFISLASSILLAIFAVEHVGGMTSLKTQLAERFGSNHSFLNFVPNLSFDESAQQDVGTLSASTFLVYIGMQWWAQKYADGGGKHIQRMSSAKDEENAVLGSLWFAMLTYALQMWPWIVVGVVALVLFPGLEDPESGYPKVMMEVMPPGFLGLALLALVSAFMSTIDTHLNLGASYVVNDIYARFLKPDASQKHYVRVSQLSIVVLVVISCLIAWQIDSIANTWKFVLAFSSGAGLTLIARWIWWRANAWTEIVGMIASGLFATTIKLIWPEIGHGILILVVVAFSTLCWLIATYATAPVDQKTLIAFYERVHPSPLLWGDIPQLASPKVGVQQAGVGGVLLDIMMGIAALMLVCFGVGVAIFQSAIAGALMLFAGGVITLWLVRRVASSRVSD